mgnify:CR=1 FL=1
MEHKELKTTFNRWKPIEIMLAVLFLVAPFYYHPNIGGEGLRIPNNITVWMVATIIIGYSFHLVLKRPTFVIPKYFSYITAFPILITLSGFITGVEQPLTWLFRLLFIWGGLAFFFSLFQHGLKQGRLDRILFVIVVSALFQGLVGIAQIWLQADMPFWLPNSPNGVQSGLFQQINNQATYQVTAIMIAGYLITRPLLTHGKQWMSVVLIITVAGAGFLVAVSGSRIGALTLILGLLIIIPALWQRFKANKKLVMLTAMALLVGVSFGVVQGNSHAIDKAVAMQSGYSGSARLGIYTIAVDLIKQQPVFGHGIGSFGRVFQYAKPEFYQSHPEAVLPNQYVTHPHNESLFWLVECGVIAGMGLLIVLIGIILVLKRLDWQRGGAYMAILLPMGLHTQVELPLYTSAIHWMLLLFLVMMMFNHIVFYKCLHMSAIAIKLANFLAAMLIVLALLFLAHTIQSHYDYIDFYQETKPNQEPFRNASVNPYLRAETQWINMSSVLYSSMQLGFPDNVRAYVKWGELLLVEKPDVKLYEKLADSYRYLGDFNAFCNVINRGLLLYPDNTSFKQALLSCNK